MVHNSDEPRTPGEYVRAKRLAAGLSLRDVATTIRVSHVFLGEFERGIRQTLKRERLESLEDAIPGFSLKEFDRLSSYVRPLRISLEDAPPEYRDLGMVLARRIANKDLKPSELSNIMRILSGCDEDDE